MRKYITLATVTLAAMLPFVSCDIETSDNGNLDGFWHLVRVDTLATQGTRDMIPERIYWSFQSNLLKTDDKTGRNKSILLRFDRSGNSMTLSSPYIYDREAGDIELEDPALLTPFGINDVPETFNVASLSGSRMTIESPLLRLWFKKM